jgi:hypothetical protein
MRKILVFAGGIFDYDTLQKKAFTDHFHFFFEEVTSKGADKITLQNPRN